MGYGHGWHELHFQRLKKKSIQRVYKILGLLKVFRNFSFFHIVSREKKKYPTIHVPSTSEKELKKRDTLFQNR